MTTFAKTTFSHASYAIFRPTYPPLLYKLILDYHHGPKSFLVDLGCGHGLISRHLAASFGQVLGTDPSAGMISQAGKLSPPDRYPNLQLRQAGAESLPFVETASVDAAVAGQAAHWFDYSRAWPELARIVRPGGTLALWCYKDHVYVDFPRASELVLDWSYGREEEGKIGPYWEKGRHIVHQNYRTIKPPEADWEDVRRIEYEPGTEGPKSGEGTLLLSKRMTIKDSKDYLRTWSSVHAWLEAHKDEKARKDGGKGDVVDVLYDKMSLAEGWTDENQEIEMEWGSSLILARRRRRR